MKSPELPPILIVDDEPTIASLEKQILSGEGYEVEIVDTGQAALDALERHEYSLLLLDYRLPDIMGDEIVKRLGHRVYEMPVIMVTGHGDEKLAVEMLRTGAADYLTKGDPNFVNGLKKTVEIALARYALAAEKNTLQSQLLKLTETYRKIFESIPDPTCICERQPDGRITLTQANLAACELFDVSPDNVVGLESGEFFTTDPEIGMMVKLTIETGEPAKEERLIQLSSSEAPKWINLDYVKFKEDGILLMMRDISMRKNFEEANRKLREEVESFIAERATELSEANRKLQEYRERFQQLTGDDDTA